ncbi:TldD/PmbA family protein [Sporosarcina sp. Marseille-Q4943]|uniref:TldD/PmbA family protein n=1 Tax=Sporosarcina sp. Marseille-Q4943 TaxID=2942204 RepID=UPI00208DB0CE|nr:TldD/PmbA family protein [Sporosarcina sp. Marseille-Q4943]
MSNEFANEIIDYALFHKASGVEVYIENTERVVSTYDTASVSTEHRIIEEGVGIRVFFSDHYIYLAFNDFDINEIFRVIKSIVKDRVRSIEQQHIYQYFARNYDRPHDADRVPRTIPLLEQASQLYYNQSIIPRVRLRTIQEFKGVEILNADNNFRSKEHAYTRIHSTIFDSQQKLSHSMSGVSSTNVEVATILDTIEKAIHYQTINSAKKVTLPPGSYPAVVGSGTGGILLHEICGHPLELQAVVNGHSVLKDKLNMKIAPETITIVDNPLYKKEWGSSLYDDEGNPTSNNVLIQNGVLRNYLCDRFNGSLSQILANGAARRESYRYPPTARMSNTYLLPGEHDFDFLFEGIVKGVYIKELTEGAIDVATGKYQAGIKEAFLIENGRIKDPITNQIVMGNALETLENLNLVGNDLKLSKQFCGAKSGRIPVSIGQPTVRYNFLTIR